MNKDNQNNYGNVESIRIFLQYRGDEFNETIADVFAEYAFWNKADGSDFLEAKEHYMDLINHALAEMEEQPDDEEPTFNDKTCPNYEYCAMSLGESDARYIAKQIEKFYQSEKKN